MKSLKNIISTVGLTGLAALAVSECKDNKRIDVEQDNDAYIRDVAEAIITQGNGFSPQITDEVKLYGHKFVVREQLYFWEHQRDGDHPIYTQPTIKPYKDDTDIF